MIDLNEMLFPVIGDESELPFFICGVGIDTDQERTERPEGFYLHQLHIFTEGEGELGIGGNTYRISKPMIVFLPANIPHEYHKTGDVWNSCWISFDGKYMDSFLEKMQLNEPCLFSIQEHDRILRSIKEIYSVLNSDMLYGNYFASSLLYDILIRFNKLSKSFFDMESHSSVIVEGIMKYMDEHYSEKISLDDLCLESGLSRGYLCRLFMKHTGLRPMEYLNKKRIQKSKEYLNCRYISIDKIANDVGFETHSYFTRLFRQSEGMTPSEYREKVHG